jgi:RNA recognition motif-containing protein
MVKLFVGGFPLEMTELELVQLIAPHGDVSTIKIVRDKKTRVCKGYAFLEMTDRKGAEQVIEMLDGTS